MGMYNSIFGMNPMSHVILATLGLFTSDFGRFRDVWVADGKIAVYTRNGGGNRECWEDNADDCHCPGCIIEKVMPKHPNYLYDKDDSFDSTYATIYFSFPEEYAEWLKALDIHKSWDPDKRWQDMLRRLEEGNAEQSNLPE